MPAVMICLDGDAGKGSCRSYGGFNLFDALTYCSPLLEGYGGHAQAAGLTIKRENIEAFRSAFAEYYRQNPPTDTACLDIDYRVTDSEMLTMRCIKDLDLMEPCGNENPRPQLCLFGATLLEVTSIGMGKHLRLKLACLGKSYDAVFFSKNPSTLGAKAGDCVDLAFSPQINEFRSRQSVQLLVADLRAHSTLDAQLILENGQIPSHLQMPVREDFVVIYRALQKKGGRASGETWQVLRGLCPDFMEEKLALCLKVMEERGLLTLSLDEKGIELKLNAAAPKVDLFASKILSSLAN